MGRCFNEERAAHEARGASGQRAAAAVSEPLAWLQLGLLANQAVREARHVHLLPTRAFEEPVPAQHLRNSGSEARSVDYMYVNDGKDFYSNSFAVRTQDGRQNEF